ncbi:phosphatase PAP2 family protein [Aetokthonos hydrillicola Thurmond2011]|jgi:undecaprenyl-diphosphatase|uniref:Phosphatase PAP2 family protein n=1 Tax=Aetokthonos hydrillicola Thurmond2011 TaxID=2712845 RepID=A0AAP5I1F5_9CYAN|nr:phosphatase PAP2 family protein [Aetokthonos hydrillicola]MBO3460468.1 phosphatase PAP2 family protein [Aetokthonos hydrillicola CCALA 1050]MBW4588244.1 phosphatase PAP2 family protein [Aetokthonos hydrillicola CCALA 1050]MDR9893069.1 phosphatase PAP2 family protein [Aetokthonos hydrillicola Thurmond2011]
MNIDNHNLPELKAHSETIENKIEAGTKFTGKLWVQKWSSLLLLFLGVYLPLQIFELLAAKIWQNEAGFPWDIPILLAIHQTAQPYLDVLAVILAKIGSPKTLTPILLLIALTLFFQKRWRLGSYFITTGLGSTIINFAAKEFIHRARPHLWESTYHKVGFAFPSGHAMASMTFAALLVILAWETRWRLVALVFGILFVPTIAWTRLYLGVHFPSDILAGWLVSLAWVIGVYIVINPPSSALNLVTDEKQEIQ